jgi:hypothetical protein
MAEYQLTADDNIVFRPADQMWIPNDPANTQWMEYEQWLEDGGIPDPYVPPDPVPPQAQPETTVLYDHENRLRAIEGQPPLTLGEFLTKMT